MRPAIEAIREARSLLILGKHDASLIFSASAFELLLKATLLHPVVHGLVHHEALASILVEKLIGRQTDIERYEGLLSRLFKTLAGIDLGTCFGRARKTTHERGEAPTESRAPDSPSRLALLNRQS
jgi:hypothetical protein